MNFYSSFEQHKLLSVFPFQKQLKFRLAFINYLILKKTLCLETQPWRLLHFKKILISTPIRNTKKNKEKEEKEFKF